MISTNGMFNVIWVNAPNFVTVSRSASRTVVKRSLSLVVATWAGFSATIAAMPLIIFPGLLKMNDSATLFIPCSRLGILPSRASCSTTQTPQRRRDFA